MDIDKYEEKHHEMWLKLNEARDVFNDTSDVTPEVKTRMFAAMGMIDDICDFLNVDPADVHNTGNEI